VLVNWNGWQDTVECLDSLRTQEYPELQVIVVDNGSTNDSVERIRAAHSWVTLHQTGANLGYAAGCNAGIRLAHATGAEYLWLLNNDTIAPPATLTNLVRTALENPKAGAIGAVLHYRHDPARVQAWGGGSIQLWSAFVRHFHAPASFSPHNTFLTGACMLVPRAVFERVGIFHEGFFMYCDDSDWCLRLHRAGYALVVAETTAILHKEGASSPRRSALIDQFAATSTIRLLLRQAPLPAVSIAVYLALRLLNRARRREWANIAGVLRGVQVAWRERGRSFTDRL
jgi:GT2 family glycosyltransferase